MDPEIKTVPQAEYDELKRTLQRAQASIRDLLVTYRPHLMGNWVERTVIECGLKLDALNMIRLPDEKGCSFPEDSIFFYEWTVGGGTVTFGAHESEDDFAFRRKKLEQDGSYLTLLKKEYRCSREELKAQNKVTER